MAISDYKITAQDLDGKGNIGMPDTPNLTTQQMQEKLDELSLDVIVPAFNELVDYLNDNVDADHTIKAEDITNLRLDADGKIQVSLDHGTTWITGGASGHLIMDGSGTTYPARSRLQFSQNVIITDNEAANKTFVSVYGEKGDKGDGATIRIGEVYDSDVAEVTNSGSETDAIFDFGLPRGEQGAAASIRVGTVTSGANASVYNTGTSEEAVFNFVLPKGDQGDPGTGLTLLDTYATYEELIAAHPTGQRGQAYFVGDSTEGVVYLWSATESAWVNVGALKGQKGDQGDAATITVGTVTEGNTMAVENVGTSTEAVFNFTLVKGDKGDQGNAGTIAIGTVTSGTTPSVTNVGTPTQAILNFVIPKGDKGDKGSPSVVNGKSGDSITLTSGDILLTGYTPVEEYTEILPTDTISEAIAKLEARPGASPMTINVTIDESMIGDTLRAFNLDEEYTQVATSTLTTFNVLTEGVWTVEDVTSGTSAEIELRKDYDVELSAVSYKDWLDSAGITDTFGSLENVLADQITVRKLMTIHASADYLYDWCEIDREILDTIMDSTYGAKWLGLRDYVCDKFMANESFKGTMLNSDNWEYILKDHAPIMTSNSTPYGTASANGVHSEPYLAFNGDTSYTSTAVCSKGMPAWIQYKSTNPICVKKVSLTNDKEKVYNGPKTSSIEGSNDGINWTKICDMPDCNDNITYTVDCPENDKYYIYHRIYATESNFINDGQWLCVNELQFYGRSLNVSVPVMTSNTAPYGEVKASSAYASFSAYKAFTGTITNYNDAWLANSKLGNISYDFRKPIVVKWFVIANRNHTDNNGRTKSFKLRGSNDGVNFVDVTETIDRGSADVSAYVTYHDINNNNAYRYYMVDILESYGTNYAGIGYCNFYGVDYSEREFESGSTIKYLYDHGLELYDFSKMNHTTVTKKESEIVLNDTGSGSGDGYDGYLTISPINLTSYNLLRGVVGDDIMSVQPTTCYPLGVVSNKTLTSFTLVSYISLPFSMFPNSVHLDIKAITQSLYIGMAISLNERGGKISYKELWLE